MWQQKQTCIRARWAAFHEEGKTPTSILPIRWEGVSTLSWKDWPWRRVHIPPPVQVGRGSTPSTRGLGAGNVVGVPRNVNWEAVFLLFLITYPLLTGKKPVASQKGFSGLDKRTQPCYISIDLESTRVNGPVPRHKLDFLIVLHTLQPFKSMDLFIDFRCVTSQSILQIIMEKSQQNWRKFQAQFPDRGDQFLDT